MNRASGIVLHPTSIPGPHGIGDLGGNAYKFIDFLADSKQKLWQILPLGPTSYGDSPYQCLSSMAGNPLLISLEVLRDHGYLSAEALSNVPDFPSSHVDFGWVIPWKKDLLRTAFQQFHANANDEDRAAYREFCANNVFWLEDFVTFSAIKDAHEGRSWIEWPAAFRSRDESTLTKWKSDNQFELDHQRFLQFQFYRQWHYLRSYANQRGIQIIGDIPIFVAFDSSDVWANQHLFELDEQGNPLVVAGVPPDYFSATGQRWGNPLYRWNLMEQDDYSWWRMRIKALLSQVDIIRIDHFRGFESYWEIPASEPTAMQGRWVKGPDIKFFQKIKQYFGDIKIIAEDLGVITPEVEALREGAGLPGMRIFQFGFCDNPNFLPHRYIPNCVVYTGTHDNNTTRGWFNGIPDHERQFWYRYVGEPTDEQNVTPKMIRMLWSSVANTVLIPLQDALNLGEECRMNFPGKASGNWGWRYHQDQLSGPLRCWLADMTEVYQR